MTRLALIAQALLLPVAAADRWVARRRRFLFGERPSLVVPLFHSVVPSAGDLRHHIDPLYAITQQQLAECIEYFRANDFTPIGLPQLAEGIDPRRNHVMFTFDDGYANNLAALDMLERAGIPALLSVNTGVIRAGEAFWWDVLYREMLEAGAPPAAIERDRERFTLMEPAEIRAELIARYGQGALRPRGEIDRPMSVAELKAIARHPLVSFANHTSQHTLLFARDQKFSAAVLQEAQDEFAALVGIVPTAVAYPYGKYDDALLECCTQMNFELGFAAGSAKALVPDDLSGPARMRVPRCVIYGNKPIAPQCENGHLDWKPSWTLRRWARGLRRAEPSAPTQAR